ncbi:putative bifunctional diguanylate cyclase/phosphodiesterase [Methylocystis parvus]|uniref:EAL domain-containing protein n=1 Tax=Methylocystis parvus TaxID=134 RepID=A0A6B8M1K9_9HYPH|nr:EAL domain-containing protein [Methylocystis parvus]QGM98757.1 EAL domain-containing protein [Methylocystis parvus]WBK00892.1 EAL domain-containing protein [Methylocystis parvus OBBP]
MDATTTYATRALYFGKSLLSSLQRLDRFGRTVKLVKGSRRARNWARAAERKGDLLRAAMDELPEGVVLLDPDGRYIHWNRSYAEIYARSADLFRIGVRMVDTLREGVARGDYPEAFGREAEWVEERMRRLANPGQRHEQQLANGRWIMIDERRLPNDCTIGLRIDITEMKAREDSFRLLFESNPIPMFVLDEKTHRIVAVNDATIAHYGYPGDALKGMSFEDIAASGQVSFDAPEKPDMHFRADGAKIDVLIYWRKFVYEGKAAVLVAAVDTTERNRAEARIAFMARHDPLTNLPNRAAFRECLECALSAGAELAVFLVDLDYFKQVNDTLGHSVGDRVLQAASLRLLEAAGHQDVVTRLGGDEFAILRRGCADQESIARYSDGLLQNLYRPFDIDGHTIVIGASVGVACAPRDSHCPEALLRQADLALYASKNAGRGVCSVFEPALDQAARDRAILDSELRCAVARREFVVHYQPIVDLRSGAVRTMEALVRWRHPTRGLVPPGEFIPFAEQSLLISQIGEFVLEQACADAAAWPRDVKVAVNVSPLQFRQSNMFATVARILERTGLAPGRLEIEITESLLMERAEATLATLQALRALGVSISLDDFGTGFSSLTYLRSFPFDKIKIDRAFTQAIGADPASHAIIDTIVALGSRLGMRVTAEGVENATQMRYLADIGCNEGQGYYFSHGRPADELDELLDAGKGRIAA